MFVVKYLSHIIGFLAKIDGEWEFQYSDYMRSEECKFNPIFDFPDVNKIYNSDRLFVFFRQRIPFRSKMTDTILKAEGIDREDEVAMLKRFGRFYLTSCYELIYTENNV